jgi:hypothetical protein
VSLSIFHLWNYNVDYLPADFLALFLLPPDFFTDFLTDFLALRGPLPFTFFDFDLDELDLFDDLDFLLDE